MSANRGILSKHQLRWFKAWLIKNGYKLLEPVGEYEKLRWKPESGKAMPIIFNKQSAIVHYTCNTAAIPFVMKWIAEKKDKVT